MWENRQKEMIGLVSVTAAHFLANDLTCAPVAFVQIGLRSISRRSVIAKNNANAGRFPFENFPDAIRVGPKELTLPIV